MARFTPCLLPDALSADIRFRYFLEGGRWNTILIFLALGKPIVKIRPQKQTLIGTLRGFFPRNGRLYVS